MEDAVVMYDKKTGRSRGFGFITYDNPDVVRKVRRHTNVTSAWGGSIPLDICKNMMAQQESNCLTEVHACVLQG